MLVIQDNKHMNEFFNNLNQFYNKHPNIIIFLLLLVGLVLIMPLIGIKGTLFAGGIICMIAAVITACAYYLD
jgi:hypothetical protein